MSRAAGAVATSDPRATDTAAAVLRAGGNAVDAAVTAAFALAVLEPHTSGVGGDAFLITASPDQTPQALDGAGAVPGALTMEQLGVDGLDGVPVAGARSVTVPGAVSLYETALVRYGTISLADAVAPAIELARGGFVVRSGLADAVRRAAGELRADPVLGPLYVPDGRPVANGESIRNPVIADCLETIANEGAKVFYDGALADAVVATVRASGGYLTHDDLARHRTEPIELETTEFAGTTVWELPLPTQGPAVLRALDRIDGSHTLPEVDDWMTMVEAVREGLRETGFDPAAAPVRRPDPARGNTTYLAAVDGQGGAASLITSVFGEFGARIGVAALGAPLHNRAATFVMVGRPVAPGKPPHTTIPALVTGRAGELRYALGVAGGIVQPQVQVQLLIRVLWERMGPQAAVDAPRFKLMHGGELAVEPGHPLAVIDPDAVDRPGNPPGFGAAQIVGYHDGLLQAGADARRGGAARVLT